MILAVLLYDILYGLAFLLYLPVLLFRKKWHAGFWQRMGVVSLGLDSQSSEQRSIWIHAVSVGEVLAVCSLVERLQRSRPDLGQVVSVVTQTGYTLAKQRLPQDVVVIYAPLDFRLAVRRYMRQIRPVVYIAAETELWPGMLSVLWQQQVPMAIVNGRISERSYRRYQHVRKLLRPLLAGVRLWCMQTETDAERARQLGAVPKAVHVVGNLKFDEVKDVPGYEPSQFGYRPEDRVWVAGSTHPGEERMILRVFKNLQKEEASLRLMIAPRHIERVAEVARDIEDAGCQPLRFSEYQGQSSGPETVMLIDTIGHLRACYALATCVFVGKSLCAKGGQNILEPAAFAKPVIVGPHMENFLAVTDIFLREGALLQVSSEQELQEALLRLLKNPNHAVALGQAARCVLQNHQGALEHMVTLLWPLFAARADRAERPDS